MKLYPDFFPVSLESLSEVLSIIWNFISKIIYFIVEVNAWNLVRTKPRILIPIFQCLTFYELLSYLYIIERNNYADTEFYFILYLTFTFYRHSLNFISIPGN